MSFLSLFEVFLHHPHPTRVPVDEEGSLILRRLHELREETPPRKPLSGVVRRDIPHPGRATTDRSE